MLIRFVFIEIKVKYQIEQGRHAELVKNTKWYIRINGVSTQLAKNADFLNQDDDDKDQQQPQQKNASSKSAADRIRINVLLAD